MKPEITNIRHLMKHSQLGMQFRGWFWGLIAITCVSVLLQMACTETHTVAVAGNDNRNAKEDCAHPPTCVAGTMRCEGDMVVRCNNGEWKYWDDCGLQGLACTATGGEYQCVAQLATTFDNAPN